MTRLLLVRLSAMGDVVQSLGAVAALVAARPDLELVFCTQRPFAPLLDGLQGIAAVEPFDRGAGIRGVLDLRRRLRRHGCATALDLQGNGKSAMVAWLSGARERIGVDGPFRQEPWSRRLLTHRVAVPGQLHPAACALAVVRAVAPAAVAMPPRLCVETAEVARAEVAVRAAGLDPGRPFRVLVVVDPADARAQRPAAFAREIADSPLPVLLLVGPAETRVSTPSGVPVLRQAHGELRQLVGLGGLVAHVGGDVVGPDSGASHVLAACGARTTVLFGAQDPARTAPPSAVAVVHASPPSCMPCRRRTCRHPRGPVCMEFTSAEGRALGSVDRTVR